MNLQRMIDKEMRAVQNTNKNKIGANKLKMRTARRNRKAEERGRRKRMCQSEINPHEAEQWKSAYTTDIKCLHRERASDEIAKNQN